MKLNTTTGDVSVYGVDQSYRFLGRKSPITETLFTLSGNLLEEAKNSDLGASKSPELSKICQRIWQKAQKKILGLITKTIKTLPQGRAFRI